MGTLKFRNFVENADELFGYKTNKKPYDDDDVLLSSPIRQFNVELMMDLLENKKIGVYQPHSNFSNEMIWGDGPGAIKLEIDTGYTFYVKQLSSDKQGEPRWVTRKIYQLNRQGYGGLEDKVAQEIFEQIEMCSQGNLESPVEEYRGLEGLVLHIYDKIKNSAKPIFIPEGIRKMNDNIYIIKLGVRGHGLETPHGNRIEQNQTMVSYDESSGTIKLINYNLESPVGGGHKWEIGTKDLDLTFFPTQSKEEISETISVHLKYY